ncbi:hypothetical protein AVEN_60372-1 [Araneus ventricosus]|uniref:Uncharacterized protein n=1 Tax=Araneus ventricosus TaxID=182803 RepID=A0A4Y2MH58_ARAVE|nr:hypothetical protein AVEN_60372-1 [Araneus ventricosus]
MEMPEEFTTLDADTSDPPEKQMTTATVAGLVVFGSMAQDSDLAILRQLQQWHSEGKWLPGLKRIHPCHASCHTYHGPAPPERGTFRHLSSGNSTHTIAISTREARIRILIGRLLIRELAVPSVGAWVRLDIVTSRFSATRRLFWNRPRTFDPWSDGEDNL